MTKDECYRLSKSTFGVRLEEGKRSLTVAIPRDSVIKIVSPVETPQKMIEVDWHGLRVMMFAKDVHERGVLVDCSGAEASKT